MLRRIAQLVFITLGCLVVLFVAYVAVALQFASSSTGGTLASGRAVTARSDSWYISTGYFDDTATVDTAGRSIVVAPTQLTVDGSLYANISKDAKAIDVIVRDGEVSFTADGKPVTPHRR